MEEQRAEQVVEILRSQRRFAHVERSGVYQFGVRLVLPDGRYAVWDTDGAAGLEATILQDGLLVGFVPRIPGSESYDVAQTAAAIADADYERDSVPDEPAGADGAATPRPAAAATPPPAPALPPPGPAPAAPAPAGPAPARSARAVPSPPPPAGGLIDRLRRLTGR